MEQIGTHIILNGRSCEVDFERLEILEITQSIKALIIKSGMTILGECFHDFSTPAGAFTYMCLLGESHFSLHTFPEEKKITCDIYSCNMTHDFSPEMEKVIDLVCEIFLIREIEKQILKR